MNGAHGGGAAGGGRPQVGSSSQFYSEMRFFGTLFFYHLSSHGRGRYPEAFLRLSAKALEPDLVHLRPCHTHLGKQDRWICLEGKLEIPGSLISEPKHRDSV